MSADLTRGLAGGKPWLLMEHSTSAVNWQPRNIAKLPGEMRRNSFAHIARGADGTLFFQWRQSRGGGERYHSAMVPHAGTDTKVYREVCQVGAEYEQVCRAGRVHCGRPRRGRSTTTSRGGRCSQDAHPTVDFDYHEAAFSSSTRRSGTLGVTVDFVAPGTNLSAYQLVVVPAFYAVPTRTPPWSPTTWRAAGMCVVTYLSGVADEHLRRAARRLPRCVPGRARRVDRGVLPAARGRDGDVD